MPLKKTFNGKTKKTSYFFDKQANVSLVIRLFIAVCGVLFILDFILKRHSSHPWEQIPGFYAFYGFIGCVLLVIIAKWMRLIIKRPPDYYHKGEKANREHIHTTEKPGDNDVAP